MCPESKIKRSQTRLAQAPYERLGVGKTISVVAHIKILKSCFSSFNVVFILSDHFFDFRPIFKCHTQRMKESIESSGADLYGKSFEKKWLILGEAISRNLISFSFCRFPDSGHFWITQKNQNQSIQSRKISCNWRFFFFFPFISKGKNFRVEQKNPYIVNYWWAGTGVTNYIYSTILVIPKIYVFLLVYVTSILLLIMRSESTSTAWVVLSTAGSFSVTWCKPEHDAFQNLRRTC